MSCTCKTLEALFTGRLLKGIIVVLRYTMHNINFQMKLKLKQNILEAQTTNNS